MDDQLNDYEEVLKPSQSDGAGMCKDEENASCQLSATCSCSLEPEMSSPITEGHESISGLLQLDENVPKAAAPAKPHKSKTCPIKQRFKICEKRTLSGSSENLLNDDRPRKNFKLCRGFIKRWFHSSDTCRSTASTGTCSYVEEQNAFEDVVGQVSTSENEHQDSKATDSTRTSDKLSCSCSDMLTEVISTLNKKPFPRENQLPCLSAETTSSSNVQEARNLILDAHHREDSKDDYFSDITEDFSTSHHCLSLMPPQVIAHIFSYLTLRELLCTAALVCKHWQCMSQISSLWIKIKLQDYTNVSDEVLIRICSRHCSVGLLDLSDCLKITDDGLERALVYCKMLREIFLIRCSQLTEKAFLSIAANCSNLTHIDVSGCAGLTDKALQSISERCPLLQKLRLKQCPLISDTSLLVVAHSCPRLKVLTFMDNDKITDVTLGALAKHCHNLEILCLQYCSIGPPGLMQVTKLYLLKKLDLSNLPTLTSESVKQVAKHCRMLDTLNLSLSRDVSDDCVSCVATSCKKLTTLFLISCAVTDQALFSIGDNSTLLEHLDVSWCANITGHGATYVSDHCPRLKYLGLIRCNKVNDTVVERMVEDHPHIHYSTFLLDSKRLIDKAKEQGFVASE